MFIYPSMSYYGKGGVSADFVGMARAMRRRRHLMCSRCITPDAAVILRQASLMMATLRTGLLLAKKLTRAWCRHGRIRCYPLEMWICARSPARFVPKSFGGYSEEDARKTLADATVKTLRAIRRHGASYRKRWASTHDVPVVDFGRQNFWSCRRVFVQYQITAQDEP